MNHLLIVMLCYLFKRYLVVIDDLWSIPAWEILKVAFPSNTLGSRLIVTTRIVDVAASCVPSDGRIYHMEPLDAHQSKSLFIKRCDVLFEDVVDGILEKCGGLPLAIICISGLLASKPPVKEDWIKVRDSIGSQVERLNMILRMSYNDLPRHLKTCLLYLSIYPEDHIIERDTLVNK